MARVLDGVPWTDGTEDDQTAELEERNDESDDDIGGDAVQEHIDTAAGAHPASAIAFTPAGSIAATNVQAAIVEAAAEGGGGGGGTVDTIGEGTGIDVDASDPANPIVSIEAGVYRSDGTDVAVADGGTGASNASGARTNLGLVIGTDVAAASEPVAAAHIVDGSAAHAASAVSVADAGALFTGTDVEAVLAELAGMGGGGSAAATTFDDTGLTYSVGGDVQAALEAVDARLIIAVASDGTLDNKIDARTRLPTDTESGAFAVQADQAYKVVEASNASPFNVTVPTPASLGWSAGDWVEVYQEGAGQITFVAGGSTTLRSRGGALKIAGQYGGARLRVKDASGNGVWAVEGDLTT